MRSGDWLCVLSCFTTACASPREAIEPKSSQVTSTSTSTAPVGPAPTIAASSAAAPTALDPNAVRVQSRAMPERVSIDGNLSEWGNAPGVTIAIDASRVVLAVGWDKAPERGIVLALADANVRYPDVGWISRGGSTHAVTDETCRFDQQPQAEGAWRNGGKQPPEAVAACLKVLTRHETKVAGYAQRFLRTYRITRNAIVPEGPGAAPAWVAGAKVAAGEHGVEVELSLAALPELWNAPLSTLHVAASVGDLPKGLGTIVARHDADYKLIPPVGWTSLKLASPIGFGPRAGLLAKELDGRWGASYHPTDPEHLRLVDTDDVPYKEGSTWNQPNRPDTHESIQPVYTPYFRFKNIDIGLTCFGEVATYSGKDFVALERFVKPTERRQVGEALHLFAFEPGRWSSIGNLLPQWAAIAVNADGTIELLMDANSIDLRLDGKPLWTGTPTPFFDPTSGMLGIRGISKGKPRTERLVWSAAEHRYKDPAEPERIPDNVEEPSGDEQ